MFRQLLMISALIPRWFFIFILTLGVTGLSVGTPENEAAGEAEPTDAVEVVEIAEVVEVAPLETPAKVQATKPAKVLTQRWKEEGRPARVVVIPVRDQIAEPILYVIRRGLKSAIEQDADLVVLDMKTPGGSLGTTFEILEAIGKFEGATATFVNDEAISAGAFISAMTDDIYFAMRMKIVSYLKARIRAISEGHTFRGQVISAMIDSDYELKIGEEVLKEKGELLSLTATEASKTYGDPAEPLLAAGIYDSIDDLLVGLFGTTGYSVEKLETTWSEDFAAFLNSISPLLLGLGLLGLYIEFKTPGFGIFGVGGGLCLGLVFLGNYTAGLSGHEPALFFGLGVLLILVELIFFPGIIIAALSGVMLMLGSLIWSMADLWPNEPISFSGDVFVGPLQNMGMGFVVSIILMILFLRFIPKGWFWDRMILVAAAGVKNAQARAVAASQIQSLVGKEGFAATDLYPSGQIEIDGARFEAKAELGVIDAGRRVRVRRQGEFALIVEPIGSEDEL
jgi:membrane-bound serine protease (ClpP class)